MTTTSDVLGQSSSLSPWAGPYVTQMLGQGAALANMPYTAYQGPLTAGPSGVQQNVFQGLAGLATPNISGSFTDAGVAQQYMNPYIQQALDPQIAEARRQADITRAQQSGRLGRAGAYGGGRQAVLEGELYSGLGRTLADITGRGYLDAYNQAANQYNIEQNRGLQALPLMMQAGEAQRQIEQQGITADIAQFEQERDFPYKQVQYMQSLLQGLPISTQSYQYAEPSALSNIMSGAGGIASIIDLLGYGKQG